MKTLDKIILACAMVSFLAFFSYAFMLIGTQRGHVGVDVVIVLCGLGALISLLVFLLVLRRYPGVYDYFMRSLEKESPEP